MLDVEQPTTKRNSRLEPEGLELRMATVDDVPALVTIGREQFAVSNYAQHGIEYSDIAVENYTAMVIEHGFVPHLVATVNDVVVGFISFSYDSSFSKRPVAVLQNLFVTKKYRRTIIGRMLVDAACFIAEDEQACAFFAPVNNGGAHINSLGNLLGKAGFKMSGYIMTRSL